MALTSTVCFTGHRQQKLGGFERNPTTDYVKVALQGAIERAVKQKVECFISGGALGVDQWAADTVNYAEKNGKPILVIDPKEESERWIINRKDGNDGV